MEDELQPILEGGQEYGDEYKEIRRDILNKVKDIREKQLADDLKEKEVKTLSPEVLLYLDNNDKSFWIMRWNLKMLFKPRFYGTLFAKCSLKKRRCMSWIMSI